MSSPRRSVAPVGELRIDRIIDLPRGIVWEAFLDPVLVKGWLHPSEQLVEGTSPVEFREPENAVTPAVLHVISPIFGELRVEFEGIAGGRRGEATRLCLRVVGGKLSDELWAARLDQLESLLLGRPVNWACVAPLERGISVARDAPLEETPHQ